MSLLFDSDRKPRHTLTALWKAAHAKDAQEADVVPFWQHLLSRFEFGEEHWVIDAEVKPEPTSRRRVDRGVRYLSPQNEFVVLLWIESKKGVSERERESCEKQALQACQETLRSHKWQRDLFALTTLKTKGKAWHYEAGSEELVAMHDEEYIEANSSEGYQLSKCFEKMKRFGPAPVAAARQSHIPTAPSYQSTAYGAASQTYSQPMAYGATSYGAPTAAGPNSTNYVNPIFRRDPTTQTARSVSRDPWAGYTEVVARLDPRDGAKGLIYRVPGGWKPFGTASKSTKDGQNVFYSNEKKIWVYEKDLLK